MPQPNYEKFDLTPYIEKKGYHHARFRREITLMTSYGCPHNCVFCANRALRGSKVAYRDIEDVINEIKYLKQKYAVEYVQFEDDHILTNRKRAERLFTRMIEEKLGVAFYLMGAAWTLDEEIVDLMVRAGATEIEIALESGCDRVFHEIIHKPLKKEQIPPVVKICRDRGLYVRLNLVIGLPGETWNEIRESIAFAEKCNADHLNIAIATPFPRTDLYALALKTNALPADFDFFSPDFLGYSKGVITTKEFTPVELEILRTFEWDRINFSTAEKRKAYCEYRGLTEQELEDF